MPVPLIQYAGEDQKAKIIYANGDSMKISCHRDNGIADVIWTDCKGDMTEHYRYVYDEGGNLMHKVDMIRGKAYNYFHKNGNVIRVENENILLNAKGDITVKNLENAISYVYDSERKLIKTCIRDAEGNEQ